jgi:NAD(P)-dependent dehydrogenase (short-subunit alcohol dehydrogenase family)
MAEVCAGRFSGTSAAVTGGASGIGEATAARFLREGANVLVFDVDAAAIDACTERLERSAALGGGRLLTDRGDVTIPADIDAMVALAVEELGGIDVLVSNAGIAYEEPFLEIPFEHWARTIDVNLTAMFLVCQRVARHMVGRQGARSILLTSSTNGLVGEDQYAHYNASKGGVTLLTKSLAIELGPHGIRVNAVCPGYIVTPLAESIDSPQFMAAYAEKLPLRHLGSPDDVAAAFAFLASADASFITGETLVIDGGQLTY